MFFSVFYNGFIFIEDDVVQTPDREEPMDIPEGKIELYEGIKYNLNLLACKSTFMFLGRPCTSCCCYSVCFFGYARDFIRDQKEVFRGI